MHTVTFMPAGITVEVTAGTSLLSAQIAAGLTPDAPCGGNGTCGKCRVTLDGERILACQTTVTRDMTVVLPEHGKERILTQSSDTVLPADGTHDYSIAFDIGTTTIVGFLLDGKRGVLLSTAGTRNPQTQYGADVISRIQAVLDGNGDALRRCVTEALAELTEELAKKAGILPQQITLACVVGNTAMHHLFLGLDPTPLITPPYLPAQTNAIEEPVQQRLPISPDSTLRVLPNIAGFVGADTVGCLLAAEFDRLHSLTLLIDIGTNGEMVLGDSTRRMACSTAAGPAFEGAKISQGMCGATGAIDHVWLDNGTLHFHVIGEESPVGICGSGLLDLITCLLDMGELDESGLLAHKQYTIPDTNVTLTQKDVREVQLAKGAIRAGIELMCCQLAVQPEEIQTVLLAGAFGNYLSPGSACRIGMIPPCLETKIRGIGNAAGDGAKRAAVNRAEFLRATALATGTEFLELASLSEFQDRFIDALDFSEEENDV